MLRLRRARARRAPRLEPSDLLEDLLRIELVERPLRHERARPAPGRRMQRAAVRPTRAADGRSRAAFRASAPAGGRGAVGGAGGESSVRAAWTTMWWAEWTAASRTGRGSRMITSAA